LTKVITGVFRLGEEAVKNDVGVAMYLDKENSFFARVLS